MKVVLIGDSIRMGYQHLVVRKCREAEVWGPAENGRHGIWVLDHFEEWVAHQRPDIVHANFGLHDATVQADGEPQIVLHQYRLCVRRFIAWVRELGNTGLIWATTTPLYVPEEGVPMARWRKREEARIETYNTAALEIVQREGIPVNDLHGVIMDNDFSRCLQEDGCHITEFGNEVLSDAVVKAIRSYMILQEDR